MKRPTVRTAERAVVKAAIRFFNGGKPCEWTRAQHLHNPQVNTTSHREKVLARSVSALLAARERKGVRK